MECLKISNNINHFTF